MTRFSGKVEQHGQTLIEGVIVNLTYESRYAPGQNPSGSLVLPEGRSLSPGQTYRLVLEDGRSQEFRVLTVSPRGEVQIQFAGQL